MKNEWNTSIVATQKGNTAHLPTKHSVFTSRCKNYLRGLSETLHSAELTVTYWKDNNAVVFPDRPLGREHWHFIETQDKSNCIKIYASNVAHQYRSMHGWVNRSNQALSY